MTGLPTRDAGAIELLQGLFQGGALDGLALLTWLGSVPVVLGLLAAFYWFEDRNRGAFGLGVTLGALALTVALKAAFALPRPPNAVRLVEASGFGFPSGHAIAATAAWGYLALALDRGSRRARLGVAAAVVGLVAVSRVALGVHYAVDVLAGVLVGGAFLLGMARFDDAVMAFWVAAAAALLAVLATGGGSDAALLLGAPVAGGLLWPRIAVPEKPWRREGLLPAVGGGGGIGALVVVGYRWELAAPLTFVVGTVAMAGVLALPGLVESVRER